MSSSSNNFLFNSAQGVQANIVPGGSNPAGTSNGGATAPWNPVPTAAPQFSGGGVFNPSSLYNPNSFYKYNQNDPNTYGYGGSNSAMPTWFNQGQTPAYLLNGFNPSEAYKNADIFNLLQKNPNLDPSAYSNFVKGQTGMMGDPAQISAMNPQAAAALQQMGLPVTQDNVARWFKTSGNPTWANDQNAWWNKGAYADPSFMSGSYWNVPGGQTGPGTGLDTAPVTNSRQMPGVQPGAMQQLRTNDPESPGVSGNFDVTSVLTQDNTNYDTGGNADPALGGLNIGKVDPALTGNQIPTGGGEGTPITTQPIDQIVTALTGGKGRTGPAPIRGLANMTGTDGGTGITPVNPGDPTNPTNPVNPITPPINPAVPVDYNTQGTPGSLFTGSSVGSLLGASGNTALASQLDNIFGKGVGGLVAQFLQQGAGFNPNAVTAMTNAFAPYEQEGMADIKEAFGAAGMRDSSSAALASEKFLRDLTLGKDNIFASQYGQSVDRYSNTLNQLLQSAQSSEANKLGPLDYLNALLPFLSKLPGMFANTGGNTQTVTINGLPVGAPGSGTTPPTFPPGTKTAPPSGGGTSPPSTTFPPTQFPPGTITPPSGGSTTKIGNVTFPDGTKIPDWLTQLPPDMQTWITQNGLTGVFDPGRNINTGTDPINGGIGGSTGIEDLLNQWVSGHVGDANNTGTGLINNLTGSTGSYNPWDFLNSLTGDAMTGVTGPGSGGTTGSGGGGSDPTGGEDDWMFWGDNSDGYGG